MVTKKRNIKNCILFGFFSKYLYFKNDKKIPSLNIWYYTSKLE